MTRQELEALRDRVNALSPSKRLILAAGLIDKGEMDLAETIAENVVIEIKAARLFRKP